MEKIERYVEQACRGIAGPRSLRAHIRQELREHLLDAVAEHLAAGMSENEALARALEDFGGPDAVRAELEATHGHRLMTVVLDKALLWKEKTMKARWIWASWALVALALTVAMEIVLIGGVLVFLVPKYREMAKSGPVMDSPMSHGIVQWSLNVFNALQVVYENFVWVLVAVALVWFLFEWRVRSENKSLMRFSALGTAAAILVIVAGFATAAISLPFLITVSAHSVPVGAEQDVMDRMEALDQSVAELDRAAAGGNAQSIMAHVDDAVEKSRRIRPYGVDPMAIAFMREGQNIAQFDRDVRAAQDALVEMRNLPSDDDRGRVKAALEKFHAAYDPIRQLVPREGAPATQSR